MEFKSQILQKKKSDEGFSSDFRIAAIVFSNNIQHLLPQSIL